MAQCPVISWLSHQPSYVLFGKRELEAFFLLLTHGNTRERPSSLSFAQLPGTCCAHTHTHIGTYTRAELHKPCNFIDNMCTLWIAICRYLQYDVCVCVSICVLVSRQRSSICTTAGKCQVSALFFCCFWAWVLSAFLAGAAAAILFIRQLAIYCRQWNPRMLYVINSCQSCCFWLPIIHFTFLSN